MINFEHVYKSYGRDIHALNDVSFKVSPGEFVFVSGPSGAGKSTLLKLIAGLEAPTKGLIQINGQAISNLSARMRPYLRRSVATILQNIYLLNDRTVLNNILFPLIVTGHSSKEALHRAKAAIDKVGLVGMEDFYPMELSGGNQQRLAIARAIINRPSILIADEPTSSLDKVSAKKIIEVFRDFNRAGVTTLVATHDESLISEYTTRVLSVQSGTLQRSYP